MVPLPLTRRRALALGAAAGAGVLARPARVPFAAAAPASGAASFTLPLPTGAVTGGATQVLRPRGAFDLLGLTGAGITHAHLDVRARRAGGRWSRWVPLHPAADHAPDRGGRASTDPIWTGRADELQLRASRAVGPLTVHFERVDRPAGASAAAVVRASTSVAGSPAFVPRADWGAGKYPPRNAPSYGRVDLAMVHHTETSNDYSAADSPGIVLAIDNYHRNTNGWSDIGYNFLVDKYGTIFEGRYGGVDKAVIGAQAQGYNSFSTGISCIGSFTATDLPEAALAAVTRLIAWKLPLHGAPVTGQIVETSGGGSLNAHPYGAKVTLNRISGHRDGDSTDCPGDALYAQLPALRTRVAAAVGVSPAPTAAPKLSIVAAATSVAYGTQAGFHGTLLDGSGAPLAGVSVAIEKLSPSKRWIRMAVARTAADGTWSGTVGWKLAGQVRARATVGSAVLSPAVTVTLAPRLVAGPVTVRTGGVVVRGTVTPAGPVKAIAQRRTGGVWVAAASRTVRPRANGVVAVSLALATSGTYRVWLSSFGVTTTPTTVKVTAAPRTGGVTG